MTLKMKKARHRVRKKPHGSLSDIKLGAKGKAVVIAVLVVLAVILIPLSFAFLLICIVVLPILLLGSGAYAVYSKASDAISMRRNEKRILAVRTEVTETLAQKDQDIDLLYHTEGAPEDEEKGEEKDGELETRKPVLRKKIEARRELLQDELRTVERLWFYNVSWGERVLSGSYGSGDRV